MRRSGGRSWLLVQLRRRGLAAPAALLAEMHRPLAPLLSDLSTFVSPLIEPLLGADILADLTSEEGVDTLITELSSSRSDEFQSTG